MSFRLKLSRCAVKPTISTNSPEYEIFEQLHSPITHLYTLGALLGRGAVASVRLGIERSTGKEVAVKIVNILNLSTRSLEDLNREVRILYASNHANIVHLIRAYRDATHCYLVQELVSGGELFDAILRTGHIREHRARDIARHLSSAIAYLHCKGIAHRDIKPENVLMSHTSDVVKLADFGLAVEIQTSSPANLKRFCGTPMYVAPEIVERATHGFKADVWSLGVLFYVMLSGETPFPDEDDADNLWNLIKEGKWSFKDCSTNVWDTISIDCKDLISNMLIVNPEKRYSAQDVCNHCWFASSNTSSSSSSSSSSSASVLPIAPSLESGIEKHGSVGAMSTNANNESVQPLPLQRQRSQSFAQFRRIATRTVSKMQLLPEQNSTKNTSRSPSPLPSSNLSLLTSSSSSSSSSAASFLSPSSSSASSTISPRSSARRKLIF